MTKAVQLYQQSANQGNSRAIYNLGIMYADGKGVTQDYAKAKQLWEIAAKQGLAQAQEALQALQKMGY